MEVEDAEEVEDADSGAAESCLARKLASLGIGVQATIPHSEHKAKHFWSKFQAIFPHPQRSQFTRLSSRCHKTFI